jgi:aminopeptidase N
MKRYRFFFFSALLGLMFHSTLSSAQTDHAYTLADTLRGSNGEGRRLWDVVHYDLTLKPDLKTKRISGEVQIKFLDAGARLIQLDLQEPMQINQITLGKKKCAFSRQGNVYWVTLPKRSCFQSKKRTLSITFSGIPRSAKRAPWDGGWVWNTDSMGNPFVGVACQGLGASAWFPCKDIQSDEPDFGCRMQIEVPDSLVAVSNGNLIKFTHDSANRTKIFYWETTSPINNYNIVPYIGNYTLIEDRYDGIEGTLSLRYWVLKHQVEKARKQFNQVKKMLTAFEHYFGAYPFYRDGYQLVESPYLGMEHQSAIAYGNGYQQGYMGMDRSGTGLGLDWDFIIVHESGHEWFGNSITASDLGENWMHESFTTYAEALFIEYYKGKQAAETYLVGLRKKIDNDDPLLAPLGVNQDPTSDIYNKGANVIHTLRQWINDDAVFLGGIREMTRLFRHRIVSSTEMEQFWTAWSGLPLAAFFNQYLRTTKIPELELRSGSSGVWTMQWKNVVPGFAMPVDLQINDSLYHRIFPTDQPIELNMRLEKEKTRIRVHPGYLIHFSE